MTSTISIRFAGAALSALLALGAQWPAKAESVPASFDCAKAGNTVEKLICSQAVLRWQDLSLSRAYRAARDAVTGSARDDLVLAQRDWCASATGAASPIGLSRNWPTRQPNWASRLTSA